MTNQGNKFIFNMFCFQPHLEIKCPLQRDDLGDTLFSPVHRGWRWRLVLHYMPHETNMRKENKTNKAKQMIAVVWLNTQWHLPQWHHAKISCLHCSVLSSLTEANTQPIEGHMWTRLGQASWERWSLSNPWSQSSGYMGEGWGQTCKWNILEDLWRKWCPKYRLVQKLTCPGFNSRLWGVGRLGGEAGHWKILYLICHFCKPRFLEAKRCVLGFEGY